MFVRVSATDDVTSDTSLTASTVVYITITKQSQLNNRRQVVPAQDWYIASHLAILIPIYETVLLLTL